MSDHPFSFLSSGPADSSDPTGERGESGQEGEAPRVMVVGPDGMAVEMPPGEEGTDDRSVTDLVDQPAKVMRIGSMIKQLLEEVRGSSLDEASRARLKEIHRRSIKELEEGLAPELVEELERLSLPFADDAVPSRVRAADRPGAAGRLAGGALPRHPDGAVRPADGGARAVRGDASPRAAARGCQQATDGPPQQRPQGTGTGQYL